MWEDLLFFYCSVSFDLLCVRCMVALCHREGGMVKSWLPKSVQINMFHSPWMLDRHRKGDCLHSDAGHPLLAFSFLLVFQSLKRHDPFKWLFTCIRRRGKALLNELLSTIQLEWPSQQHSFPHYTMPSTTSLQHRQKQEDQRAEVVTPVRSKSHYTSYFRNWSEIQSWSLVLTVKEWY